MINLIWINDWWCGGTSVENYFYNSFCSACSKIIRCMGIIAFLSKNWIKCYQLFLGGSFEIRIYEEEWSSDSSELKAYGRVDPPTDFYIYESLYYKLSYI